MNLDEIKQRKCAVIGCRGTLIDKCPSCNYKNITYSQSCDSCGFSWEKFTTQEKANICDSCNKEIKMGDEYGTNEEIDEVYCKDCLE